MHIPFFHTIIRVIHFIISEPQCACQKVCAIIYMIRLILYVSTVSSSKHSLVQRTQMNRVAYLIY